VFAVVLGGHEADCGRAEVVACEVEVVSLAMVRQRGHVPSISARTGRVGQSTEHELYQRAAQSRSAVKGMMVKGRVETGLCGYSYRLDCGGNRKCFLMFSDGVGWADSLHCRSKWSTAVVSLARRQLYN
jgi:hypothetical protein